MSSDPGAHRREACDEFGSSYEQRCMNWFSSRYIPIRESTSQENKFHHIDFWFQTNDGRWHGVDVKSHKPAGHVVEAVGVKGHAGWLHGRQRFLAFYVSCTEFYLVERNQFRDYIFRDDVCGDPPIGELPIGRMSDFKPFTWFQRIGNQDCIAKIDGIFKKIEEQDYIWHMKLS